MSLILKIRDVFLYSRRKPNNNTSRFSSSLNPTVLFCLIVFLFSILWSDSPLSSVQCVPLPQPSSAWNQPALAINTINPSRESKKGIMGPGGGNGGGGGGTSGGNKGKSAAPALPGSSSSNGHHRHNHNNHNNNNGNGNGNNEIQRKKTYTWNTIMHYGLAGGSDHNIRHKAKKLRDHGKLPCPFDQIRSWFDGKCRPAPRFSLYRVG